MYRACWILLLLTLGCNGSTNPDSAVATPPVEMAVTGAKAIRMPMRRELNLLGSTVAMRHLTVRAPAAGRVLGLTLQVGDRVTRGQIIAHVLNREVEAAQNGLAVARSLDPSEAPAFAAAIKRNSVEGAIPIAAPETAIVAQRMVTTGQIVADLDPLLDLIDPRSIYVDAAIPVEDLAQIRPGMAAVITSPISPGLQYSGRVDSLAPSLNQGGATATARIEFDGAARITQDGAPAEAQVVTEFVPNALVIPAGAVFENAANRTWYVFVAGPDHIAHRRIVTLGIHTEQLAQITAGVTAGETVITSGGYALSDGLHVQVALAQ